MATNRQKRNGYSSENHSHSTIKLTPGNALEFLLEISTLSKVELESKYGDLTKLSVVLGDDAE